MSKALIFLIIIHLSFTEVTSKKQCKCGINPSIGRTKRIIGGDMAGYNEFPWFAHIFYNYEHICGGTIINNLYILTAGHCVSGSKQNIFVVVGNPEIIPGNNTNQLKVAYTQVYEHFQSDETHHHDIYDIALIRLNESLKLESGRVWPVCLPQYKTVIANVLGIIVASEWGIVRNYKIGTMRKGTVSLLSTHECRRTRISQYVTENYNQIICARSFEYDACQGDSGGPLLIRDYKPATIAGIISWGVKCANPKYPGVYTNVKYFYRWIKFHTKDADYCSH